MKIPSIATNSFGLTALPPWAQEQREKNAILADPRLENRTVANIDKIDGGYRLTLDDGTVHTVEVHYVKQENGICSPAKFELIFPNSL